MPKVFITQESMRTDPLSRELVPSFDLAPAAIFGELTVLVPMGWSVVSSVPLVRRLREKLRDFTEEDYLLPIGDPGVMAVAAMVAGQMNNGRVKLLKWDRRNRIYVPVQVDLSGKEQ